MRLWSLHPKYLDQIGLVALWREGLLAKKVLEGKTKGYKNHPQLLRFKTENKTLEKINLYLHFVCDEAERREYQFKRSKLSRRKALVKKMTITTGQLDYEWNHLLKKQFKRSKEDFLRNQKITRPRAHPLFKRQNGRIADWEVMLTK